MVSENAIIEIRNLDAGYQGNQVLSSVSLSIMEHDFIGIIGPNGGGKTTLLKVLMGLMKPLKGTIKYAIDRSEIGYLPQGNQLDERFPITVREVVASGLNSNLLSGFRIKQAGHRSAGENTVQYGP